MEVKTGGHTDAVQALLEYMMTSWGIVTVVLMSLVIYGNACPAEKTAKCTSAEMRT
jgi:hypothetical protein